MKDSNISNTQNASPNLSPSPPTSSGLDVDKVLKILQKDGLLSLALKGFEPRLAQQQMMANILDAYNNQAIALIEAGTGTGKSIAYLIPALLWASQKKERTVISTNTITLQEQLVNKDIPMLTKALNIETKAVLVKGMSNYVCLRKLEETKQELRLFPAEELEEIEKLDAWAHTSVDGTRSDLSFVPTPGAWDRISAENDTCNRQECPHFQECHFFKARRQANDAQILVVNHHLLFADLALRAETQNYKNPAVLPLYSRIVLDEAHNIEDIATDYFASRISRMDILRTSARLASDKNSKSQGKLLFLKEKLQEQYRNHSSRDSSSLMSKFNIELPGLRRDLLQQTSDAFQTFANFIKLLQPSDKNQSLSDDAQGDSKLRLLPFHKTHPMWSQEIIPRTQQLINALVQYVAALNSIEANFKSMNNERLLEQTKGTRFEITALASRLVESSEILKNFIADNCPATSVRWIEVQMMRTMSNIHLVDAELNIAKRLVNFLFSKFSTVILCSATLTTNKQFHFIKKRLGITSELLPNRRLIEAIYDSPFDYQKQALFAVPTDIAHPQDVNFSQDAAEKIWQAIQASRGNAFVLFTSYSQLKTCYQILSKRFSDNRYHVLKQGDDNRQSLLNKFKSTDRSILFGTDSFWEGVDVAGEALRCVIIVKLPFRVPSEPMIQARTESILAQGGDPFVDYSLPNAVVKFKQGFGRLIRNKKDRGCIVCLDSRLLNKGYGQIFLNSLPPCQRLFAEGENLQKQMTEFYRSTNYLLKN
jgi:ATP-dependent DNA helicase DinG